MRRGMRITWHTDVESVPLCYEVPQNLIYVVLGMNFNLNCLEEIKFLLVNIPHPVFSSRKEKFNKYQSNNPATKHK